MNKKMRVIMVGVGGFGGFRRERMRETQLFEIVAAYDHSAEALAKCQAEDGARPAPSFEALLETPDVEALVISTGAKFHAEQAIAALERGLHVFVEKPLCATPQEVELLLEAERRNGRVVGCGHVDHSCNNRSLHIKRLLTDGIFGQFATFEYTIAHSGGLEIKPGDWRGDAGKNPGGMLFQCGCHGFHELMFYFGPIRRVSSMMRYDVHTTQTADVAHCLVEFESGLIGTVSSYHITPYRHTLHLFGTAMSLYVDDRAEDYGDQEIIRAQRRGNCIAEPLEPFPLEQGGDRCGNLRSFYKAVREGGTPYPSLKDGARAVAVVFAAEEAAKSGCAVTVEAI
jgi:predicted dehydrogenase